METESIFWMGFLLQIVWGLIGTLNHGDTFIDVFPTLSTIGTSRRAEWKALPIESILDLLSQLAYPQILLPGCFSNLSICQLWIPDELLYHFPQLKFDDEDGTSITTRIYDFIKFCESYKINDEEFACVLFFLTLKGRVNNGSIPYHPPPSIISIIYSRSFIKPLICMITEMFIWSENGALRLLI